MLRNKRMSSLADKHDAEAEVFSGKSKRVKKVKEPKKSKKKVKSKRRK